MENKILCLNDGLTPLMLSLLADEAAEIIQISEDELSGWLRRRSFAGIILDSPADKDIISRLDELSPFARRYGSVDVIANRRGKLTGYSTVGLGLMKLLEHEGFDLQGKRVAVIGDGRTEKAIISTIMDLGGLAVSVLPEALACEKDECDILICTHENVSSKDAKGFETVIDLSYPPMRSPLVYETQIRGGKAVGGLEMRYQQLLAGWQLITDREVTTDQQDQYRRELLRRCRNIVIIGMPTAGKSTVSEMVRSRYGRTIVEMDELIEQKTGMSIPEYFASHGEQAFRDQESAICQSLTQGNGLIVSTGGGVVKRHENMLALAANSLILWLDRDLELLQSRDDRPLSGDRDSLARLFAQRRSLYDQYSDIRIENNLTPEEVMKVLEEIL